MKKNKNLQFEKLKENKNMQLTPNLKHETKLKQKTQLLVYWFFLSIY